jgi:hypothetical protein
MRGSVRIRLAPPRIPGRSSSRTAEPPSGRARPVGRGRGHVLASFASATPDDRGGLGFVKGVDYLHIRADGRCQLDIHAEITTEDGKKISLAADGVAIPEEGSSVLQLKENVTLTSNHPEYAWVNPIQVWAPGAVEVSKGEIRIKAYAV